jgi:D-xylonolactonase
MGDRSSAGLWVRGQHRLGESILWHEARQRFFWIDLMDPALWSCPATGADPDCRPLPLPPPIGSIAATTSDRHLMLAHRSGLSLLNIDTLGLEPWCDPEQGRDGIIFNDMKCDRWGRLWVGTSHERECDPRGALWCVKDRNTWRLADVGFPISNGPAFSPDGATMYVNDSFNRQTFAYDIRAGDLRATNRRVLATYSEAEGMPDGLTVDATGHICSAQWGGAAVIRLSPEGETRTHFAVPAGNVTSQCFGGAGSARLYVTTARDGLSAEALAAQPLTGSLFTLDALAPGLPEPLFPIDVPTEQTR